MTNHTLGLVVFAISLSVVSEPTWTHKLKVFATAEGSRLAGYAYFTPGGRPHQAAVTVTDADGNVLATTITDDEGRFAVEAKRRVDHHITVGGGDGHVATYTIKADELPDRLLPSLPASLPQTGEASKKILPALPASDADWRAFIDQSIARQIRPLREQLDAYQEKIWWHDVLGGIGYILGLGGLAFGLAERRRRMDAHRSQP
ncbi:MAG: carboxypeptidase regulatory-like domain-containing protein [Candidatus Competibacteraceae bacterium]|nr:carboxypeptidase regulatory-like domain-containing protein [Candidatus Competibacteraceae bacterium]